MVIYKITNLVNNKVYIGQTTRSIEERWADHCSNRKKTSLISSAIIKHGKENFTIEILESCSDLETLNLKEKEYIQLYKSMNLDIGYNLMTGGLNSQHGPEARKKMSDSHKGNTYRRGKKSSIETRLKQSTALKGRTKSPEHKANIGKARKGIPMSEEAKKKLSDSCKGRIPWNKGSKV